MHVMAVVARICALLFLLKISQPGECLEQAVFRRNEQEYLANHIIATKEATAEIECSMHCLADGLCVSVNFKTFGIGKGRCELNNGTIQEASYIDKQKNLEYNHLYIIVKVRNYKH
jgi:hypothetical protein